MVRVSSAVAAEDVTEDKNAIVARIVDDKIIYDRRPRTKENCEDDRAQKGSLKTSLRPRTDVEGGSCPQSITLITTMVFILFQLGPAPTTT